MCDVHALSPSCWARSSRPKHTAQMKTKCPPWNVTLVHFSFRVCGHLGEYTSIYCTQTGCDGSQSFWSRSDATFSKRLLAYQSRCTWWHLVFIDCVSRHRLAIFEVLGVTTKPVEGSFGKCHVCWHTSRRWEAGAKQSREDVSVGHGVWRSYCRVLKWAWRRGCGGCPAEWQPKGEQGAVRLAPASLSTVTASPGLLWLWLRLRLRACCVVPHVALHPAFKKNCKSAGCFFSLLRVLCTPRCHILTRSVFRKNTELLPFFFFFSFFSSVSSPFLPSPPLSFLFLFQLCRWRRTTSQ